MKTNHFVDFTSAGSSFFLKGVSGCWYRIFSAVAAFNVFVKYSPKTLNVKLEIAKC